MKIRLVIAGMLTAMSTAAFASGEVGGDDLKFTMEACTKDRKETAHAWGAFPGMLTDQYSDTDRHRANDFIGDLTAMFQTETAKATKEEYLDATSAFHQLYHKKMYELIKRHDLKGLPQLVGGDQNPPLTPGCTL